MTLPHLSVRVAFASSPNDSSLTWAEIGPAAAAGPGNLGWVRKVQTKRGRERLLRTQAQFQAGTATVTLDNRDRRFDPTNTAGPYYPDVQPEKIIQVGATWSGTFYPIWTGFVDDWPQSWPGFSEAEVAVTATDLFKSLGIARVLSSGYPTQVLADGAAGYWRLNDPPGTTVFSDSSGGGHQGRLSPADGTVTFGQSGLLVGSPSSSVELTEPAASTGQSTVTVPGMVPSCTGGVTVETWVELPTTNAFPWDLTFPFILGGQRYGAFVQGPTSGILGGFAVHDESGVSAGATFSAPTMDDGTPHHVVVTISSSWAITVYVDGVSRGTSTVSAFGTWSRTDPSIYVTTLGVSYPAADAKFQEWAIYPTVLSAAQVANHYRLAAFKAQTTDGYVNQLLDWLGIPASRRNVETGYTMCQEDVQNESQTKALDFLQKIEQTEQGQCFVGADGTLNFLNRYHRYVNPNLTSQATIGDGGAAYPSEIPFDMGGVTLNFDRVELFNDIAVTRRGGNLQDATDATSIGAYGNRAAPGLSDVLMAADLDALYCAQWILADTKDPQFRVGQLVIDPRVDDRWWPVVLGLELGDMVTINKHNIPGGGPAVSLACRIEGIEHQIDPPNHWKVVMHVSLTGTNPWLVLDDPVTSLLDTGCRWGW